MCEYVCVVERCVYDTRSDTLDNIHSLLSLSLSHTRAHLYVHTKHPHSYHTHNHTTLVYRVRGCIAIAGVAQVLYMILLLKRWTCFPGTTRCVFVGGKVCVCMSACKCMFEFVVTCTLTKHEIHIRTSIKQTKQV